MIAERLKQYLTENSAAFEHHVHRTAYTAQQVAAEEHVPGRIMAKTVVLVANGGFILAVLPAPLRVDVQKLRDTLGKSSLRLATETEFSTLFPDSETGAMPPFGNLYGLPVYVDTSLAAANEIVFNAGTHRDTIRMLYADFARLAQPQVVSLAFERTAA
jgi:Ala-tRNA(Pro) deacylase